MVVVVALLAERSLLRSEIHGSKPSIGRIHLFVNRIALKRRKQNEAAKTG